MAIVITIQNRERPRRVNAVLLRRITRRLLAEELALADVELGIYLVADPEMTRINEGFLQHAGSTDVITFDYTERQGRLPKMKAPVTGEIFVCVDEAIRQARRFQTRWQAEVVRYVVHGVLHLLGYDDKRAKPRQKMKREENRLVTALTKQFPVSKLARTR